MPTTVAALRGKLGSTQYYIISMKAGELVKTVTIPSDSPEKWSAMTIEERYQRDLNRARVRDHIAPYLARDPDRFFGAIIVAAENFSSNQFHPMTKIANVPTAWAVATESMGILDFTGGEVFLPLDGQHRLKALQFAIEGHDNGKKIVGMDPLPQLANEDITVILVPHEIKKSRRIFTKINCYAKPTTKGQNLVTDDDNIFAVTARKVTNKIIGANLVKYKEVGQNLSPKDPFFTTLATIADCNEAILKGAFPSDKFNPKQAVVDMEQKSMYIDKVNEVWEHLTKNIECFSLLLADKKESGNEKRQKIREKNLLGKAIPQWCLVKVFVKLRNTDNLSLKKASDQLNKIDWNKKNPLWDGLLIGGDGQFFYKHKVVASDIVYYMCGGKMTPAAEQKLLLQYKGFFPTVMQDTMKLPKKV